MTLDITVYRDRAQAFTSMLDLEFYRHYAGLKDGYDIEPVFATYSDLFEPSAIHEIRSREGQSSGTLGRQLRHLLHFAVSGMIELATRKETAEIARREAELELDLDGEPMPFRQASVIQANDPDPGRRSDIERNRNDLIEHELNPLHLQMTEREHEIASELGWASYREMYAELKGIDLAALEGQTRSFLDLTEDRFAALVEPQTRAQVGVGLDEFQRSDLPYFFRAAGHDDLFPQEDLVSSFKRTLSGMGIDLDGQSNVVLDAEPRPKKSPRAFCSTVRVPDEIYLVLPRFGGREDFSALFHEGGHAEHFAHTDPDLPFEFRHLGDGSVTEGFAFLLDHLVENGRWLGSVLAIPDAGMEELDHFARAAKLILLRRYAAKLRYELTLHSAQHIPENAAGDYARLLSQATHIEWPTTTYLTDVDAGFYVANYLRAWGIEASLRRLLVKRFGEEWFAEKEASELIKSLWRFGQRLSAEELLAEAGAEPMDFRLLAHDLL